MKPIMIAIAAFCLALFSSAVLAGYGSKLCSDDDAYYCYKVKRGDTWSRLFDNEQTRDLVMRINRMNIRIHPGMTLAIPKNLEVDNDPLNYSPFRRQIEAPGEKVILVSLSKLAFGAYDSEGNLEYWGPVSGARGYCPDIRRGCHTPTGHFSIYSKQGSGCKSTKFPVGRGGAPMPYCMFFHGGFALHGSYEVPGYNASHGCVRLFVNDAQWLNQEFTQDSRGVPVIISQ
jgi:lipoprotein-anchoring transpeptidase ErfK/SrfK